MLCSVTFVVLLWKNQFAENRRNNSQIDSSAPPCEEGKRYILWIYIERNDATHVSILHSGLVSLATQAQAHRQKRHDTKAPARNIPNVLIVAFYLRFKLMQSCYNALVS